MLNQIKSESKSFKDFCLKIKKAIKTNDNLNNDIELETSFLDKEYNSIKLVQRLWHFYNNINEVWFCPICKTKPLHFLRDFSMDRNLIYSKSCNDKKCIYEKREVDFEQKHGVRNPSQLDEIKIKKEETTLKNHGFKYTLQSKEKRELVASKCLELYGTSNIAESEVIKKRKSDTCLKKYGVTHHRKSKIISDKISDSCKEKYGVEHYFQSKEFRKQFVESSIEKYGVDNPNKNEVVRAKIEATNIDKYGVINPALNDSIKRKIVETNLERYNCEYTSQVISVKQKTKRTFDLKFQNTYVELGYEVISMDDDKNILLKCPKCGEIFSGGRDFLNQRKYLGMDLCTHCFPYRTYSFTENLIADYIESLGFEIEKSNRSILNGKEIDVYIPSLKLGFEFNGIYWHSSDLKHKLYHHDKKMLASEQDINLIHIWEDDWQYKNDIIKSRIKNILGISEFKLFARKCSIVEVTASDSKTFLEQNHIQGHIGAKRRLGLEYEGNLVSLMTFGIRNNKTEMLRFCNKLNYSVVGGFSKLLNHFRKDYKENIYSYADLDWTKPNENVYLKNGFQFVKKTEPGYFWVKDEIRLSRHQFQKNKLIKQGFDASKTEEEIMYERKFLKIYNSGNHLYKI